MKNNILLFIILGIVFTITPISVNAANLNSINEKNFKAHHPFYMEKVSKYHISAVGTELDLYKQQALEDIDSIYNETQNKTYDPNIKVLIDEAYNGLIEDLKNVTNVNDIASGVVNFLGINIVLYTEEFENKLVAFSTVAMLDTKLVKSGTSYDALKTKLVKELDNNFNCYKKIRNSFNSYYWSMIEGRIDNSKKIINESTDLKTLITALAEVRLELQDIPGLDIFVSDLSSDPYCEAQYSIDEPDDEDFYDDEEFYEGDYENLKEEFEINTPGEIDTYNVVFTNKQIYRIKEAYSIYLDNYVNRQLDRSGYDNSSLITDYNNIIKNIDSCYNVNEIASYAERSLENLINKTGVEYRDYTNTKYKKLLKALNALKDIYVDKEVYSEEYLSKNDDIISNAIELIEPYNIGKEVEIPTDYITRVENYLKKSPTYAEELQDAKTRTITSLKKYLNNKKYNQTKVVPIVNEGIKKINACTNIDKVWEIYDIYIAKANATINKYKITTSKTGYGTITKSTTVTYGKNFTVYMTPNKGYKVKSVTVDGKAVTRTTKYTFKNIVKAHTIKVVFVKK